MTADKLDEIAGAFTRFWARELTAAERREGTEIARKAFHAGWAEAIEAIAARSKP